MDATMIDLGPATIARVYPEWEHERNGTPVPNLQVYGTTGAGVCRIDLKGKDRLVTLATAILSALGEAPAEQSPSQAAKELITTREQLVVAENRIASLEGALNLAGKQMEEAQAEARRLACVLEEQAEARGRKPRKRATPEATPAPAEPATPDLPEGVTREEFEAWAESQRARGVTEHVDPHEYKRLRDAGLVDRAAVAAKPSPVATVAEASIPRDPAPEVALPVDHGAHHGPLQAGGLATVEVATEAGRPDEPHLTEAGLAETQAVIDAMPEDPIVGGGPAPAYPEGWLRLPEPKLEVGETVVVLVVDAAAPGGWSTPEGVVMQVFPDAHKATVKIGDATPCVTDTDKLKALPAGPAIDWETVPKDEAEDEDADRFLTPDERKAFIRHTTERLGFSADRVQAAMDEYLGFTATERLTLAKRDLVLAKLEDQVKLLF